MTDSWIKIFVGCAALFCLTTAATAESGANPNRSGLNCILAPPDDTTSSSGAAVQSSHAAPAVDQSVKQSASSPKQISSSAAAQSSDTATAADQSVKQSSAVNPKSSMQSTQITGHSADSTAGDQSDHSSSSSSQSSSAKLLTSAGKAKKTDSTPKAPSSEPSARITADSYEPVPKGTADFISSSSKSESSGSDSASQIKPQTGEPDSKKIPSKPADQSSASLSSNSHSKSQKVAAAVQSGSEAAKSETAASKSKSSSSGSVSNLPAQIGTQDDTADSAQLLDESTPDAAATQVGAKAQPLQDSSKKAPKQSASTGSVTTTNSKTAPVVTAGKSTSSAKKPDYFIPGATLVAGGAGADDSGTKFDNSKWIERTSKNQQSNVWTELDSLRGHEVMSAGEIQDILAKAVAGKDYPNYGTIPATKFSCENVNQPGFYADPETRCQGIRRCDINGIKWNYLCPNATLFNQITLTCDWYFNIDCSKAIQYYDYSNPRLYHSDWLFLDTPPESLA